MANPDALKINKKKNDNDTKVASNKKTWQQEVKASQLKKIKAYTNAGEHAKASALFKKVFPGI